MKCIRQSVREGTSSPISWVGPGEMMEHNVRLFGFLYCSRISKTLRERATLFATDCAGTVAAEFVVVLPALLAVFILIASACVLLVTSSEVQQVSFELARGSVRYFEPGMQSEALCNSIKNDLAPSVVKTGDLLSEQRFSAIDCDLDSSDALTVTVTYDMTNHPMSGLADLIGLNVLQFTRTTKIWL
jgi:Flp pilus assembly protein TadG